MYSLIIFLFSNILNNIAKYGTTVFLAIYFLPFELAIYQKQLLIITYIQLLFFGVSNYMNREIPVLISKNKKLQINLLVSSVHAYRNFFTFLLATIAMIYYLIFDNLRITLYILSGIVSLLLSLQLTLYRGFNQFNKLSLFLVLANVFFITFIYIASELGNINAVLFSFIISTLISFIILEKISFMQTFKHLKLRNNIILQMAKKGKYLAINGLFFSLLVNMDKLLLALFFSNETLGLYSFINAFTSFSILFIMLLTQFYFPKLMKMSYTNRMYTLKKITPIMIVFIILFNSITYVVLPDIIKTYYIKYYPSLDYLSISLVISTLISLIGYMGIYFNISYEEINYTKLLALILVQIALWSIIIFVFNISSIWLVFSSICFSILLGIVLFIVILSDKK